MVKLSASKVARMLGLKRSKVQHQINIDKLHTHEGYVTINNVHLGYPEFNFCSEQDNNIKCVNQIREHAHHRAYESQLLYNENKQKLLEYIANVQRQVRQYKKAN